MDRVAMMKLDNGLLQQVFCFQVIFQIAKHYGVD